MKTAGTSKGALATVFGIVFIDLVGFGIMIPILPLYAQQFGATPLTIGLLLASYSLMQFIFSPILGRLSDRFGRRPILLLSILGSSAAFLMMGLAHTLWFLFLARILDGVTGGNISTVQAYIADVTEAKDRSKGMGLIGAAFGLGFIFGPAIGGVMSHFSMSAPFYFAAALAALNSVAVYFFLPESLKPEHKTTARRGSVREVFREAKGNSLFLVIGSYFFTTVAFSLLMATYPLFAARQFGFSAPQVGYVFAGMGILGAIIQGGLLGWLLKVLNDKTLAIMGTIILAAGFFILPLSHGVAMLVIATTATAIGHGLVAAPMNGMASKSVGAAAQGRVLGVMQSSASLARVAGPVLGGFLLNWEIVHGYPHFGRFAYWAGAAVILVSFAFTMALKVTE